MAEAPAAEPLAPALAPAAAPTEDMPCPAPGAFYTSIEECDQAIAAGLDMAKEQGVALEDLTKLGLNVTANSTRSNVFSSTSTSEQAAMRCCCGVAGMRCCCVSRRGAVASKGSLWRQFFRPCPPRSAAMRSPVDACCHPAPRPAVNGRTTSIKYRHIIYRVGWRVHWMAAVVA